MSELLTVIKADGSTGVPSERDRQVLTQMLVLLAQDVPFRALKVPTLSRAEVNAV